MNKTLLSSTLIAAVLLFIVSSCKEKKLDKEAAETNLPVLAFLQSQVKHVDTSLYSIVKTVTVGSHTDTTYLRREEFRKEAADFLAIPNLSDPAIAAEYSETKQYDETLNKAIITYNPKDVDADPFLQQQITITPDMVNGDKFSFIYLDSKETKGGQLIQKKMLWMVDRYFQITTIVQDKNGKEQATVTKVTWNDQVAPDAFPASNDTTSAVKKDSMP